MKGVAPEAKRIIPVARAFFSCGLLFADNGEYTHGEGRW